MERYFTDYADAFLAGDMARIETHFAYPAMLVNQAGADVVFGADDLAQHLTGFLAQLKAWDVRAIDANVTSSAFAGPAHATCQVAYVLKSSTGQVVSAYEYLYVLVRSESPPWRIRLAELL